METINTQCGQCNKSLVVTRPDCGRYDRIHVYGKFFCNGDCSSKYQWENDKLIPLVVAVGTNTYSRQYVYGLNQTPIEVIEMVLSQPWVAKCSEVEMYVTGIAK